MVTATKSAPDRPVRPATRSAAPKREIIKTWSFDSVGPRKYALQIAKAANGNPSLMLVEGKPQEDGTYRRSSVFVWSEDFAKFFATLGEVKQFIAANHIETPRGHKYDPNRRPRRPAGNRNPSTPSSAPRKA